MGMRVYPGPIDVLARTKRTSAVLATFALLLALGATDAAAQRAAASARATIAGCAGEIATVAADLRSRTRADLVVRVELVPLVGTAQRQTLRLRRKRSAVVRRTFRELPAGVWIGYVTYRWVRGRRTLARGSVRTSAVRVGRRRGRAFCTLPIGRRIRDTTPPQVSVEPADGGWRRTPLAVRFHASDDFSGIRAVHYSLNGGPPQSGRSFELAGEGSYVLDYAAEDIAGNRSAPARATLRVDANPPSAPAVTAPPSVTGDATPTIAWSGSTDSASGVQGYAVAVRNAAGSIVAFEQVGAGARSVSVSSGLANGAYQAQVYALDGTQPEPWVTASAPRSFEIDSSAPRALATDPPAGATIALSSAGVSPRIDFDRPLDPASVRGGDTIRFTRESAGTDPGYTVACAASPCTSVTIDPSGDLGEGVYEIAWTSGVRAEDGTPVTASSARFSVPLYEDAVEGAACAFAESSEWACGTFADALPGRQLGIQAINRLTLGNRDATTSGPGRMATFASGELVRATFSRRFRRYGSCNDSAQVDVLVDGGENAARRDSYADSVPAGPGSIQFGMPAAGSQTLALRLRLTPQTTGCSESGGSSSTGFYVDDVVIARVP